MTRFNPPRSDEIEFSLFGPGIGECAVVHLGNREWMVVDSCVSASTRRAIALDYLDQLAVDIATQVKLVIVTHWHDDHIGGISQVVSAATSADFIMSQALNQEEFFLLACEFDAANKLVKKSSSATEIVEVLEILRDRRNQCGGYGTGPSIWAQAGQLLYQGPAPSNVRVIALSPSADTVSATKGRLGQLLITGPQSFRKFHKLSPNDLSVALLVESPAFHVLLGGDLEVTDSELHGWKAVLNCKLRPKIKASGFKIPHHGSRNGDIDGIWTDLLEHNGPAILSPFAAQRKPLPLDSDIKRLKTRTPLLYSTVWPPTRQPIRRRGVDGIVQAATRIRHSIHPVPGHVRLRAPLDGDIQAVEIKLFDGGKKF